MNSDVGRRWEKNNKNRNEIKCINSMINIKTKENPNYTYTHK